MANSRVTLKIIVLGSANVGKTSIIERYCDGTFSGRRQQTVGADFNMKKLRVGDTDCILQIWDTAGQERFHSGTIGTPFYRGAHGCLIVYDVQNDDSVDQIVQWHEELNSKVDPNMFLPVIVICNKIDMIDESSKVVRINDATNKYLTRDNVIEWYKKYNYGHIETSAKEDKGLDAAMITLAGLSLEARRENEANIVNNKSNDRFTITSAYGKKKKNSCCK